MEGSTITKKNIKNQKQKLVDEQTLTKQLYHAKAKYLNKPLKYNPTDRGMAFNFITDLIAGLFVGLLVGFQLDKFFNTKPLFIFIFLIIGIAVGFYIFYKDNFLKQSKIPTTDKNDA